MMQESNGMREEESLRQRDYLLNEKKQIFIRTFMFLFFAAVLPWIGLPYLDIGGRKISMEAVIAVAFSINILYYLYILKYPYRHQNGRILTMAVIDILFTIFTMIYAGQISAYFAGILLWFVVGYSMRYDGMIAYEVYVLVVAAWGILYYLSAYWRSHPALYMGWLFTYLIIPFYFFQLLSRLREHMDRLYEDAERNSFKATHDPLTQLPNRFHMAETTQKYIDKGKSFALFFIDLDGFKQVNDQFGHDAGDEVLVEVAKRLNKRGIYVARMGGDEFAAIVDSGDLKEVARLANDLIDSIEKPYRIKGVKISASIGIALFPKHADNAYLLKKRADEAMYKAKFGGKGQYAIFCEEKEDQKYQNV